MWYEEEGAKEKGECEGDTHRTSHIERYARGREGKRAHCGREGRGGGRFSAEAVVMYLVTSALYFALVHLASHGRG